MANDISAFDDALLTDLVIADNLANSGYYLGTIYMGVLQRQIQVIKETENITIEWLMDKLALYIENYEYYLQYRDFILKDFLSVLKGLPDADEDLAGHYEEFSSALETIKKALKDNK